MDAEMAAKVAAITKTFQFIILNLVIFHQEDLHKVVQVTVKHTLGIGCLVSCPQILDHLIWMEDIAADL